MFFVRKPNHNTYQNAYHVNMVRVRSNRHFTYLEFTLQHQRHKNEKHRQGPISPTSRATFPVVSHVI